MAPAKSSPASPVTRSLIAEVGILWERCIIPGGTRMNHENRTREKLAGGEPAFGIFQSIGSVAVSEILANREFDWVLVDMEHGQMGIETAGDLFAAIERGGPTPLVRVPGNDQATIKRALDAGAMGVMVPLVNSGEEAARAVRYCRYAPGGLRGLGPGRASLFGIRLSWLWTYILFSVGFSMGLRRIMKLA